MFGGQYNRLYYTSSMLLKKPLPGLFILIFTPYQDVVPQRLYL